MSQEIEMERCRLDGDLRLFSLKTSPLSKSRACSQLRSQRTIPARPPSSTAILQSSTCCAKCALDTQRRIPLYSATTEASSYHLTSPHQNKDFPPFFTRLTNCHFRVLFWTSPRKHPVDFSFQSVDKLQVSTTYISNHRWHVKCTKIQTRRFLR